MLPMISVMTPTYERTHLLKRAVAIFQAYSYPNKEMIIVDDSKDPQWRPSDARIKYVRCSRTTLGRKHNIAAALAQGEIFCHQDDDDLFAPGRLSYQAEPLVAGRYSISGIRMNCIREESDGQFYHFRTDARFRPASPANIPLYNFHDSNAMYKRAIWDQGIQYTNAQVAQKVHLLNDAIRAGFKWKALDNEGQFVYARHGKNTWQFNRGLMVKISDPSFSREAWFTRALEVSVA